MRTYKVMVEPLDRAMKLLMTDLDGNELLRAVLPAFPRHPRALLTLLEGLALWVDSRIHTAISVGPKADARRLSAMSSALSARWRSLLVLSAQPTTRREWRSRITARYSQAPGVRKNVTSPTQRWFGADAVKSWLSRFGAASTVCSLSVVRTKRRRSRP